MHTFPVERDVPVPKDLGGRPTRYPFALLEVGESFFVPCPRVERTRLMNSLTSCRANAQRKLGRVFVLRVVDDDGEQGSGIRVWRTA